MTQPTHALLYAHLNRNTHIEPIARMLETNRKDMTGGDTTPRYFPIFFGSLDECCEASRSLKAGLWPKPGIVDATGSGLDAPGTGGKSEGEGVVATHPDIARTGAHLAPGRRTGRTTRLAVHHAELALSAPGRWVKVIDHHPTVAACMYLATKVDRLLIELNVPHTVRMDPPRVMVFAVERKEQP